MVFEERNNWNSVVVAGMWQRKGITRNAGKGRGSYVLMKRILKTYCWIAWKLEIGE